MLLKFGAAFLFLFLVIPGSSAKSQSYSQNGGSINKTNQTYSATSDDESGVYVTGGGTLTLTNSTVTTSGNTTPEDSSSFYGLNAGVLANS